MRRTHPSFVLRLPSQLHIMNKISGSAYMIISLPEQMFGIFYIDYSHQELRLTTRHSLPGNTRGLQELLQYRH
jgi:hypothetical protein